jgi:hypothetical protein
LGACVRVIRGNASGNGRRAGLFGTVSTAAETLGSGWAAGAHSSSSRRSSSCPICRSSFSDFAAELHPLEFEDQQLQVVDFDIARDQLGVLLQRQGAQGFHIEGVYIGKRVVRRSHYLYCAIPALSMPNIYLLLCFYLQTAICGVAVRSGRRQSMPSSSMDNCARVSATAPFSALGQTNRPRSMRKRLVLAVWIQQGIAVHP